MTDLRDIAVVLDDTAASEIRLDIAFALAQQHSAHLTGLSALELLMPTRPLRSNPEVDTQPASPLLNWGTTSPANYPEAETQAAENADRLAASFRERLRFSQLLGDWLVISGKVSETVVHQARQADLVILGQVNPNHPPPSEGRQLVEDVLMTSGRPILVIPCVGRFPTVGTRILVGWNNSREAARAVNDAMPLLAKAASVTVVEVSARKPATDDAAGVDITRHLTRHGIRAETIRTVSAGTATPDLLLNYAADVNADLLVIGGYGHSRLRELVLGGVTHDLLRHMTLPMLMSH